MIWTKKDREPFVEPHLRRVDCVEDYIENLVDVWHEYVDDWLIAGESVGLCDFLGFKNEEVTPWVRDGRVSDRITLMWIMGDY